jgi:TRAP-type mannitol/chloroaromatic compound transport system substrate-binding protein
MNRKTIMLVLSLAVIASLLVVGCAPEAAPPAEEEEAAPPAEEEEEAAPAAPEEEVIHWKVQSSFPDAMPQHSKLMVGVCEGVTALSGGRLVLEPFTGGAIAPAAKETDAVDSGVLDACQTCPYYNLDKWPSSAIFSNMVCGMSSEAARMWFDEGGGWELIDEMVADYNLYVLHPVYTAQPEVWCHSTVPIESMDDIKKLKIRSAGSGGDVLDRMGASVVAMPPGEIFEAMKRGVIDAFEAGSAAVNWMMGWQEVAQYLYFSSTRNPHDTQVYFVNKDSWEKLSPELQNIVETVARSEISKFQSWEVADDLVAREKFADYGCVLSHVPEDVERAMVEAAEEYYDERCAAEDPFYSRVVESYRNFQEAYAERAALDKPCVE